MSCKIFTFVHTRTKSDKTLKTTLIDGSKILTEALVRSGADVFVGYPITPSNLLYSYGKQRFPLFLAAPDEISTAQWMAGLSATGHLPVTSSAFPGIALMVESINMAYAMELPSIFILTQRLGPSTGSATTGAQGDLMLLKGIISGGYPLPVFSPSSYEDAWELSNKAVETALRFRTPVFILTSKEFVMTQKSFDLDRLKPLPKHTHMREISGEFKPYKPVKDLTPAFVPLGDDEYLTRFTASTHDQDANIRKNDPEALENSRRLRKKLVDNLDDFFFYEWDKQAEKPAENLILTWGITASAAREATEALRRMNVPVDLLILKTLLPVSPRIYDMMEPYENIVIAEENLTGQLKEILFGEKTPEKIRTVNKIGDMITPQEIVATFKNPAS